MTDADQEPEFGAMATWTAEAVAALGPDHAIPAGCRGSGSPAALDWLADRLDLRARSLVVDIGAGVGGPAAHLVATRDVVPLLVDPMAPACAAATQLFGHPTAVARAEALPFPDRSVDRAWCLGVLCATDDRRAAVDELARVLSPGGRAGLLVYVRTAPLGDDPPEGNDFPTTEELDADLDAADLRVADRTRASDLAPPPSEWTERADAVDDWIQTHHGATATWRTAHDDEQAVARLLDRGDVHAELTVVVST